MTQNRKQLFGVFFLLHFFFFLRVCSFLCFNGLWYQTKWLVSWAQRKWKVRGRILGSCVSYSWHLNLVFCPSYSKNLIICSLPTPLARVAAERKKNSLSKGSLCSTKTFLCQHWPFAATPSCTALALWVWEIAVGTIERIMWTRSDLLSTQSSSGRSRSEELTSLLAKLRSELHSSQDGG